MARAFVSFQGWHRGSGAQLTAPTCSLWLLSGSLGWLSTARAKTSEQQYRNTLLRGQKYLCQVHRQTHCATNTQVWCRDGMANIWGDGREGSGLHGAEACKVSVVFGGSRRFLMVLGGAICLLSPPPPFSPWICALTQIAWGRRGRHRHRQWPRDACLSFHAGDISTSTILTPAAGQGHIQLCREGDVCSEGSSGGSDSLFPPLPGERTGKKQHLCQSCGSQGWSRFYNHLLCLCLNFAQLKVKVWFEIINCVCVSTHNKGYI